MEAISKCIVLTLREYSVHMYCTHLQASAGRAIASLITLMLFLIAKRCAFLYYFVLQTVKYVNNSDAI